LLVREEDEPELSEVLVAALSEVVPGSGSSVELVGWSDVGLLLGGFADGSLEVEVDASGREEEAAVVEADASDCLDVPEDEAGLSEVDSEVGSEVCSEVSSEERSVVVVETEVGSTSVVVVVVSVSSSVVVDRWVVVIASEVVDGSSFCVVVVVVVSSGTWLVVSTSEDDGCSVEEGSEAVVVMDVTTSSEAIEEVELLPSWRLSRESSGISMEASSASATGAVASSHLSA
jgi:hypothetical protein